MNKFSAMNDISFQDYLNAWILLKYYDTPGVLHSEKDLIAYTNEVTESQQLLGKLILIAYNRRIRRTLDGLIADA